MRTLLAISWDHDELICLVASVKRDAGLRLEATHRFPLDESQPFRTTAEALAERLGAKKRSGHELLVALPRSHVEMQTLTLPPASAKELPSLVRNDMARQHAELNDASLVDYHLVDDPARVWPNPESSGDTPDAPQDSNAGALRVFSNMDATLEHAKSPSASSVVEAAMVRPETQAEIDVLATALKRKPDRIVVRYHAVASLFARQVQPLPDASLLLNMMQSTADISVLRGHNIVFTRSIHLATDAQQDPDVAHLSDEIRRTMFVAPHAVDGEPLEIQHVYMFADFREDNHVVNALADELELPVSLLDPLAGIELPGQRPDDVRRLAALAGMIWDYLQGSSPIDFANPKRPPPPAQIGRRVAFYSALALLGLSVVGYSLKRDLDQVQQQVAELKQAVENQAALAQRLAGKTVVLDAVQAWESAEINWLAELQRLSTKLPASDKTVIQRVTMAPAGGNGGIVSMNVRVRDPSLIAELENGLRDDRHQVTSQRISAAGSSDAELGVQFETTVHVSPAPPVSESR